MPWGHRETRRKYSCKCAAEILDGMFTGTIDAMECAMNGELSFMGDAAKAMTLQQINTDMERIYTAARAEVGDPGDLQHVPQTHAVSET